MPSVVEVVVRCSCRTIFTGHKVPSSCREQRRSVVKFRNRLVLVQSYARKTGSKQSLLQKVSRNGPMVSAILLIISREVVGEVIPCNSSMYSLDICVHCVRRVQLLALLFRNKALFDGGSSRRERHDTSSKVHERSDHISKNDCD